jgi:hypothetical protein
MTGSARRSPSLSLRERSLSAVPGPSTGLTESELPQTSPQPRFRGEGLLYDEYWFLDEGVLRVEIVSLPFLAIVFVLSCAFAVVVA